MYPARGRVKKIQCTTSECTIACYHEQKLIISSTALSPFSTATAIRGNLQVFSEKGGSLREFYDLLLLAPGATPRQPAVRVAGREKPVPAAMHCGVYAVMQSVRFLLSTLCICTCVFVFVFLYLCINICNHDDSLWCLRSDAIPVVPASRLSAPGIPLQIPSWGRAGQFLTGPPPAHTRIPGILDFIPRPPFIICLLAWHVLSGLCLPKPNGRYNPSPQKKHH